MTPTVRRRVVSATPAGGLSPARCRVWPFLALPILVAAVVAPAHAQPAAGPETAAAEVDLEGSRVYVFVARTGLGHDHAIVGRLESGAIRLGAAENAGRIVFDMRSFLADTPEARKVIGLEGQTDEGTRRQTTENMLGPDVLDVARHPTATFDIRSALPSGRAAGNGRPVFRLAGTFTLHGVTREVVIPAEVESTPAVIRLAGSFRIRQSDFGMKPYKKLGGVVGIADELVIHGDIRVAAAAPPQPPAAGPGLAPERPSARPPAGRLPPEQKAPESRGGPP